MIYIERTLEFKNNEAKIRREEAKMAEPIVLYKGDRNIELQFTLVNNPFNYKSGVEITYGQLIIKRPNADPIFSDVAKMSNSKVSFIITEEMINDLNELGNYDFQIRLLNADQTSRGTLPPVFAGIVIKEPVCEEDGVNFAAASYSRISLKASETVDTFDDEGNYNKTVWTKGDTITDTKLNKIEDAIYEINSDYVSDLDLDNKGYLTEHQDVSHLALKSEIPTNVSNFVNDAGYVSESYVDNVTYGLRSEMNLQLENYASKEEIPSIEGLATETYVNDAISNIEIPEGSGGNVDLSEYYGKTDVDTLLAEKSDVNHNHDSRYYLKYQVDAKINGLGIAGYAKLEDLTNWAAQFALKNHTHENYVTEGNPFIKGVLVHSGFSVDIENTEIPNNCAHVVRSNYSGFIYTLDWNGNACFAGNITVGEDNKEVATKDDLSTAIGNIDAILDNINGEEI